MLTNRKKLGIITFILFVLAITTTIPAFAKSEIPDPTTQFFVNDYSDILSSDTEDYIFSTSKKYQANGGPQVVVTTIPSLKGASIEEYSIDMARNWGIGSKEENNGVLILLALEEREIRIEVGYGLEGIITDSLSGRFIRHASSDLKRDDFDAGLRKIYDLVINELEEPGSYEEENGGGGIPLPFILIILIIIILSIFNRPNRRNGMFGGGFGGFYGGFGGGHGHSGSGGGFGGGGFSGGGGGFGGGGASGKF